MYLSPFIHLRLHINFVVFWDNTECKAARAAQTGTTLPRAAY